MDLLKSLFKGDKVIWVVFMTLCLISIIEVFSAASTLTYKSGDHWAPIAQHSFYLLLGAGVVVIVHNIPCRLLRLIPVLTLPTGIVLLLVAMLFGERVNGAGRWLPIFGIQFQPSEVAKMAVITSTALILSMMQGERNAQPKAFGYILGIVGVNCLLIAPENFSTAGMLFLVTFLLMYIGRISMKQLGKLVGCIVVSAGIAVSALFATPEKVLAETPGLHRAITWKNRLTEFFVSKDVSPQDYDIDKNAQKAHASIAIATSHVVGKMPGNSVERDFLSQAFSDFIFAIIIEELGLLGGGFVAFLYIILLIRVGRIAGQCDKKYLSLLIMGIALLLVAQAILNMMVAVGLFPVTGQPLPLISKGGTSTLINCAYIGIILSVSRYVEQMKKRQVVSIEDTEENEPVRGDKEEIVNQENISEAWTTSELSLAEEAPVDTFSPQYPSQMR